MVPIASTTIKKEFGEINSKKVIMASLTNTFGSSNAIQSCLYILATYLTNPFNSNTISHGTCFRDGSHMTHLQ